MWYVISQAAEFDNATETIEMLVRSFVFKSHAEAYAEEKRKLLDSLGLHADGDNSRFADLKDNSTGDWYHQREAYIESPKVEGKLGGLNGLWVPYNGARILVSNELPLDSFEDEDW